MSHCVSGKSSDPEGSCERPPGLGVQPGNRRVAMTTMAMTKLRAQARFDAKWTKTDIRVRTAEK